MVSVTQVDGGGAGLTLTCSADKPPLGPKQSTLDRYAQPSEAVQMAGPGDSQWYTQTQRHYWLPLHNQEICSMQKSDPLSLKLPFYDKTCRMR
ncbi:hypothetical protein NDU88_004546 [Pleurodeles waltl]|uniref:Uncharacterized protein n=1 Tax=Pleurodeles waltl TaxID=8319 RepID=A0AAV7M9J4_PLEWA|nr:hypothetical protein NDU88_004546 [Pleurodeles waltl]